MRPRFYTLYRRQAGSRAWERISANSYKKDIAIRIFQNRLLDHILACEPGELRLRPIPRDKFGA